MGQLLGRTSLELYSTVQLADLGVPGDSEATIIVEHDFADDNVCDDISATTDISAGDCEDIRTASVSWLGLGIVAILMLFVIFMFLLRIECRKLCSKPMRQICIAMLTVSFILMLTSWAVLVASPIASNFDTFASSFWVTVMASVSNLVVLVISIMEYQKVGGGAAPAAKHG